MSALKVRVYGLPAPQGSKRGFIVKGRVVIVEDAKDAVKAWRKDVATTAKVILNGQTPMSGPVALTAIFWLPRPAYHYGTGRNAGLVKARYVDAWPTVAPDLDKILRATGDALKTAKAYDDDSLVVRHLVEKRYADPQPSGALIHLTELETPMPTESAVSQ